MVSSDSLDPLRAVVNTYLSLCASTVTTIICSGFFGRYY